jgi:large subunit ribosomal protein L23
MKTAHEIIRRPIITEKGLQIKELQRTLVFEVALDATKPKSSTRGDHLQVKVDHVHQTLPGKSRRRGQRGGYRPTGRKPTCG